MAKCFAERFDGSCDALYVSQCDKDNCAFYKSIEQAKIDKDKAEERCRRLGIPSNNEYVMWKKMNDAMGKSYVMLP